MPKKKGSIIKPVMVIVVLGIVGLGVIAWHDGLIGVTPISEINAGNVPAGTQVTIKGEYTGKFFSALIIKSGNSGLLFSWDGSIPPVGAVIVVRGEVHDSLSLTNVVSVEIVWIFK